MGDGIDLSEICRTSTLMMSIDELAKVKDGFLRDYIKRILIARDEPWWDKNPSDWRLTCEHDWAPPGSYLPTYWEDRALDLCEHEITHANFGLSFTDLMEMDVATFERVEKRVLEIAKRKSDALTKQIINETKTAASVSPK